ncbi:hypothetical protein UFOVP1464_21 [uncultured Caudovirales phage]|uniref:Uncharacterized protein n=1 Tax=uncultured Caudovirales phage TaxID=2100421 RepID=A0A6J5QPW4_9CAUD|nr:hypothetical protein UFOVP1103_48 [uncultured Caudovirales phage]CAB4214166.1 hypothetical protein UFOVP1464_21 [uncultured Caudovirales phage]CAB5229412.1 hypothetical protein UFOVP1553_41 [uncultured Caudovirales phage]
MALTLTDRAKETTTTTGTGTVTLLGAATGFQSFATVGNGNTTYYCIAGQSGSEWEVGIGTYTLSGTTLSRTTVLSSSNAGLLVNFSAGTKDVFVTYPSGKSVNLDASGNATAFGTPVAFVGTNITGTAASLTAGAVTDGVYTTGSYSNPAWITALANNKITGLGSAALLTAGSANGVATLDGGGTVPTAQLPAAVLGAIKYQGTWNATTNIPTLTSSVGTQGYYYVVATAGTTTLDGISSWEIGDWAIFGTATWQKIDNTDAVTSVNGFTGTVSIAYADLAGAIPTWNQNTTGNAATVTTNANLTGGVTSVGNAATVITNANLTGGVTSVGNAATVITNANLTGEATSTGNAVTLTNSAVIGKVITGYVSGAGTVAATDTLLQAIQKLNGNTAAVVGGASLSNDTATATNVYPMFAAATSGTPTTVYTSNANLLYKPSTGEFQASVPVALNGLFVNATTLVASYTVASGQSAQSVGGTSGFTIPGGLSVTLSSGSRWVVI